MKPSVSAQHRSSSRKSNFEQSPQLGGTPQSAALTASNAIAGRTVEATGTLSVPRFADYLELTKPRIALLVLLTVTVGYAVGRTGPWHPIEFLLSLVGIGLVACASNTLNQCLERETDALMHRTADRPLPSGRMSLGDALAFGLIAGIGGCVLLAVGVNGLTASLAAVSMLLYAGVYTPLKRVSPLCTVIGAVPGAMPPVLGWTAAGGSLDAGAFSLFAVLYLWQFPHFLAIAWLYRADYARAGLLMLPSRLSYPHITGLAATCYALALVPVSLLPGEHGLAGDGYRLAALCLGVGYVYFSLRFLMTESVASARQLLWMSLVYLPLVLLALTCDHIQLLR